MIDPSGDTLPDPSTSVTGGVMLPQPPRPLLASIAGQSTKAWRGLQHFEAGRFTVFLALAFIGSLFGLSLLAGNGGDGTTFLNGSINLYTNSAVAKSAVLDIKVSPLGAYSLISIRPAFDVPSGQQVEWAVLASKSFVLRPVPGDTSNFVDPTLVSPGYPAAKVRSVMDNSGAAYWLFTGFVIGPVNELHGERHRQLTGWGSFFIAASPQQPITEGIEAAGVAAPNNADGRFSLSLPGFSNFGPDERAGFSVAENGHLLYGRGVATGVPVQWHSLDVTTHLEMATDLQGVRLDSVIPPASQISPLGLAWTVPSAQLPSGFSVSGASLDAESSAQQRIFFAGILMALSASALLAAFQERPKDLKGAVRQFRSAILATIRRKPDGVPTREAANSRDVKAVRVRRYPAWTRASGFLAAGWAISVSSIWDFWPGTPLARAFTLLVFIALLGIVCTTVVEIIYGTAYRVIAPKLAFPRYTAALRMGYALAAGTGSKSYNPRRRLMPGIIALYCITFIVVNGYYYSLHIPLSPVRIMLVMAIFYASLT